MTFIQSIILGIVQGLTEFLPISSSAHLVLVPYLLNWNLPQSQVFPFDVLVQLGTLAAVIIYFWQDLVLIIKEFVLGIIKGKPFGSLEARMGWYLILATIPAGIAGLLLKSKVEEAFSSARATALFLLLTAVMLLVAEWLGKRQKNLARMTWFDALWIGVFQAISIFPGVSRSGSTMTGGMTRQLDRPSAARFSFLMSVPVMLAAGALSVKDLLKVPHLSSFLPVMAIGFLTAGVVGYFSIRWLLSFIKKHSFFAFAIYCAALAALILIIGFIRTPAAARAQNTATPASATPVSESSAIAHKIAYTPALDGLRPTFSTCADQMKTSNLVVQEVPTGSLGTSNADVMLRLGAPDSLSLPSYTLGSEQLVFVVNQANTLQELNVAQLQQILGAQITTWGDLANSCPDCFSADLPDAVKNASIALNFYAPGEDIEVAMENAVLSGVLPARTQALIVPDPTSMVLSVGSSPTAIGFVPSMQSLVNVRQIPISDVTVSKIDLPILAITSSNAQDTTLAWLTCIQNSWKP